MRRCLRRFVFRNRKAHLALLFFSVFSFIAFFEFHDSQEKYQTNRVIPFKLIHSKTCAVPSNWRYPFCKEKVLWLQLNWQSQQDCYVKQHNINTSDDCSILRFYSEAEGSCPLLPGREKPDPLLSRPKAYLHANQTGLMELLKSDFYSWMRGRISQYWPYWVEGLQQLKKRKTNLHNRPSQNILIYLGAFAFQNWIIATANSGGPLGELVQWTDVIASLYILGHNITLIAKGDDLKRCKLRILDSFGTEAEFNFRDYPHPIQGGRSGWANINVNLPQLMTMFPHSPDNSFLGFVVDAPPKSVPMMEHTREKPIGLVYGKKVIFWKGKREYLDVLSEYFEIHATLGDYDPNSEASKKYIPKYVVNHGLLKQLDLQTLLEKAKVFIGLGFPYEGPAPLEAIAHGCIFLNAKFDPAHNRNNNEFFMGKPTFRSVTSQHPYTEDFIGEPYVFTVDISNLTAVKIAAEKILRTEVQPYLPLEWTPEGMLERVNSFTENMDFCTKDSKIWPPESQNHLIKGEIGASCKDTCTLEGLICESMYFQIINTQDTFKKLGIDCRTYKTETVLDAPSYEPKNMSCTLQNHTLAFSCVSKNPSQVRLCPCRDFQPQQVALCKSCS